MHRFLGKALGSGAQAMVYHAKDTYAKELAALTDGVFGNRFVVKVVNYTMYDYDLEGGTVASDMVHKLSMYQRILDHELAHVIPLVHWMVFLGESHILDKFNNKIEDVKTIPAGETYLLLTFPVLDGTLADICHTLPLRHRRDVCLQMIYIIQALHSIGISHYDFHPGNVMYSVLPNGDYYVRAIDLDMALDIDTDARAYDYKALCFTISHVLYDKFMIAAEFRQHGELSKCILKLTDDKNISERERMYQFAHLGGIFAKTQFTAEELYYET
jgi:serine/threonine protein kinase